MGPDRGLVRKSREPREGQGRHSFSLPSCRGKGKRQSVHGANDYQDKEESSFDIYFRKGEKKSYCSKKKEKERLAWGGKRKRDYLLKKKDPGSKNCKGEKVGTTREKGKTIRKGVSILRAIVPSRSSNGSEFGKEGEPIISSREGDDGAVIFGMAAKKILKGEERGEAFLFFHKGKGEDA